MKHFCLTKSKMWIYLRIQSMIETSEIWLFTVGNLSGWLFLGRKNLLNFDLSTLFH